MPCSAPASLKLTTISSPTLHIPREPSENDTKATALYIFPLCGALVGLTVGILLTSMTQMAYPLVQAGKPILSLPPMAVVTYESTMLTAIIFTIIGIIFESRLPSFKQGLLGTTRGSPRAT